jgi:hypothetical protein
MSFHVEGDWIAVDVAVHNSVSSESHLRMISEKIKIDLFLLITRKIRNYTILNSAG